jgi:hypothetical protein
LFRLGRQHGMFLRPQQPFPDRGERWLQQRGFRVLDLLPIQPARLLQAGRHIGLFGPRGLLRLLTRVGTEATAWGVTGLVLVEQTPGCAAGRTSEMFWPATLFTRSRARVD